jgi:hypothetical protein
MEILVLDLGAWILHILLSHLVEAIFPKMNPMVEVSLLFLPSLILVSYLIDGILNW